MSCADMSLNKTYHPMMNKITMVRKTPIIRNVLSLLFMIVLAFFLSAKPVYEILRPCVRYTSQDIVFL